MWHLARRQAHVCLGATLGLRFVCCTHVNQPNTLAHVCLTLQAPNTWPKLVIVESVSALLSPVIGASQHNQGALHHHNPSATDTLCGDHITDMTASH